MEVGDQADQVIVEVARHVDRVVHHHREHLHTHTRTHTQRECTRTACSSDEDKESADHINGEAKDPLLNLGTLVKGGISSKEDGHVSLLPNNASHTRSLLDSSHPVLNPQSHTATRWRTQSRSTHVPQNPMYGPPHGRYPQTDGMTHHQPTLS